MEEQKKGQLEESCRLLGASAGASAAEIKKCARRLFLKYHPDLNPHDRGRCEEMTKKIVDAYRTALAHAETQPAAAAGTAPPGHAAAPDAARVEALVFELAHRRFGLPASIVREVLRLEDVRVEDTMILNESFPYFTGIICNERGTAMLWNLHGQLGLRGAPLDSRLGKRKIVMIEPDDSPVGFIVDEILGIAPLNPESIIDETGGKMYDDKAHFGQYISHEDGTVLLLDIDKVLYNSAM